MPFTPPTWVRRFTEDQLKLRPHASPTVDYGLEYGYWWVEWGGQLDTIKDNEPIRDHLLAIMLGVWDHVKNGPPDAPDYPNPDSHGAANWALEWFGFLPGKRESRRFVGQYVLREDDLLTSRPFDDAIAYGGWPIDTHPPAGVDAPDEQPTTNTRMEHVYDIPLRSCVSADVDNLMFAGRNLSATHVAFASTRVMATCAVVGQGVGTAAAPAVAAKLTPAALATDAGAMRATRRRLLRDDCYLISAVHDDDKDVARLARVKASSEQSRGAAQHILTGQTRAVRSSHHSPVAPGRGRHDRHSSRSCRAETVFPA